MRASVLIATLALALGAAAPAGAIEVLENSAVQKVQPRYPDLVATHQPVLLTGTELSELPEPEVFAMMLLGLVLLGYRASRDNNEKFK